MLILKSLQSGQWPKEGWQQGPKIPGVDLLYDHAASSGAVKLVECE